MLFLWFFTYLEFSLTGYLVFILGNVDEKKPPLDLSQKAVFTNNQPKKSINLT